MEAAAINLHLPQLDVPPDVEVSLFVPEPPSGGAASPRRGGRREPAARPGGAWGQREEPRPPAGGEAGAGSQARGGSLFGSSHAAVAAPAAGSPVGGLGCWAGAGSTASPEQGAEARGAPTPATPVSPEQAAGPLLSCRGLFVSTPSSTTGGDAAPSPRGLDASAAAASNGAGFVEPPGAAAPARVEVEPAPSAAGAWAQGAALTPPPAALLAQPAEQGSGDGLAPQAMHDLSLHSSSAGDVSPQQQVTAAAGGSSIALEPLPSSSAAVPQMSNRQQKRLRGEDNKKQPQEALQHHQSVQLAPPPTSVAAEDAAVVPTTSLPAPPPADSNNMRGEGVGNKEAQGGGAV